MSNELNNKVIDYIIDTRNYQHVKRAIKKIKIKEEISTIPFLFLFEEYYTDVSLKTITQHSLKLLFEYNYLNYVNILKAYSLNFEDQPQIIISNGKDSTLLYHQIRNLAIQTLTNSGCHVSVLEIDDQIIKTYIQNPKKLNLVKQWLDEEKIENILLDFLDRKTKLQVP
ncbi:MAG: hypothetical protein NZ853_09180 [Leptospiraceae bacterium]|nr:hypothetical protein [Leptospiraceae bacterium]MDW7975601.1 hypothetical protein [Leptospiraceae bacterium]